MNVRSRSNVFISLSIAIIASFCVVRYGYQFPKILGIDNSLASVILGILCSLSAMLCNLTLGSFSLLTWKQKPTDNVNKTIMTISFIGAIPYGFLSFFSYSLLLNLIVNLGLSLIVVIVNTAIGYIALNNVTKSIVDYLGTAKLYKSIPFSEQIVRLCGVLLGILISFTMYLATFHGMHDVLKDYSLPAAYQYQLSFIIAIFAWIPVAALFANANQIIAAQLFEAVLQWRKTIANLDGKKISLIIFTIFSGSAVGSMVADSFATSKAIPEMLKLPAIQYLVYHYLIYFGVLSSGAINFNTINKCIAQWRGKAKN